MALTSRAVALTVLMVTCAAAPSARAQAAGNWDRVKQLAVGTPVRVKALHGTVAACDVVRVDDDELVCSRTRRQFFVPMTRQIALPRIKVREVRLERRLLSGLAGAGIGVGAGVAVGYGAQNGATRAEDPNVLPVVFGLLGGIVGGAVGTATDFVGGPTIYRAP